MCSPAASPLSIQAATFLPMHWRRENNIRDTPFEMLLCMLAKGGLMPEGNNMPPSLHHARRVVGYDSVICQK